MKDTLSQKDYELISEYIDQELSDADLLSFAERLGEEETLRSELSELLTVHERAQELKDVQPPRNYFLTRAMAEDARKPGILERLFPFFRTAAAFCVLALAATFLFPQVLGITPRNDYSLAAGSAESMTYESRLDEQIIMPGAAARQDNGVHMAAMPSNGVVGGTPQNQYRISMGLENHPDHMDVIWPIEGEEISPEDGSVISGNPENQDQPERNQISAPQRTSTWIRIGIGLVLAVSLAWVILTLKKRRSLRLPQEK